MVTEILRGYEDQLIVTVDGSLHWEAFAPSERRGAVHLLFYPCSDRWAEMEVTGLGFARRDGGVG